MSQKGFPEQFEIYASETSKGDTFQLVSTGEATKTSDFLEFKFEPTKFKRIKFKFKKASIDRPFVAEMRFYKQDELAEKMDRLFTDSSMNTVSDEFASLEKIQALENEVNSHPMASIYKEDIENAKILITQNKIESSISSTKKAEYYDNEKYSELFRMTLSNIKSIKNNAGHYASQVITNASDGKLDTYWETNKSNNDSFNNEIEVEFNESVTLNRVVYGARQSDRKGFAQEFEIYGSKTSKGDTYELVATGNHSKDGKIDTYWETNKSNNDSFNNEVEVEFKESVTLNRVVYGARQSDHKGFAQEFEIYGSKTSKGDTYELVATGNHDKTTGQVEAKFNPTEFKRLKGFAQEFEIYGSKTSKGDTYELVATGNHDKTTGQVEAKFNPTEFKRLKFKFVKSDQNWATLNEISFYKQDDVYEKVNSIFTSKLMTELKDEFNSKEAIDELANEVNSHPLKDELDHLIERAYKIINNDIASVNMTLPQLGDVHGHAKQDLLMSSFGTNLISTGLVATPGEVFEVYVDAEDGQPMPKIAFTQSQGHYGKWKQEFSNLISTGLVATPGEVFEVYVDAEDGQPMPKIAFTQSQGHYGKWKQEFSLKPGYNKITVPNIYDSNWSHKTNPGGAVYIINPYTEEIQGKAPVVSIEGGRKFPVYNEGDDVNKFLEELKEYKKFMDKNPDTAVNIFEYNSPRILYTGLADAAYKVYVEEGVNVEKSIKVWSDITQKMFDFAGLEDNPEVKEHDSTNLRTTIRVMQPFGGAYAAGDHVGIQNHVADDFLRIDKNSVNGIIWGTVHEIGHQMDIRPRTWGEVTNNMWSNRLSIDNGKEDNRVNYAGIYNNGATDKEDFEGYYDFDLAGKLSMFWQLESYHTGYWASLERMYRERKPSPKDEQEKRDILAKYSSEILGKDLNEYFARYKFELSEECKKDIAKFEKTTDKIWYGNTTVQTYKGSGFTDDLDLQVSTVINKENRTVTLNMSVDKENEDDKLGYEILKDGKVIGYTTGNKFVIEDSNVDSNETYQVKAYDRKFGYSDALDVNTFKPSIEAIDKVTLKLGEEFNAKDYVKAFRYDGEILDSVEIKHNVNTNEKGIYNVTYSVTDEGIKASKDMEVEVVSDYDYLSDEEWKSVETQWGTPRRNCNIKGRVNGDVKEFEKGFGIHANGKITYDLSNKDYDKFEALLGVDMDIAAQNNSSITFKIVGDGKTIHANGKITYDLSNKDYDKFEALLGVDMDIAAQNNSSITFKIVGDGKTLATTNVLKHEDDMVYVNVDVKDVKELVIEVYDGGNGNTSDHAVVANPKLITNNAKPKITTENKTYKLGEEVDFMAGVKANDAEDTSDHAVVANPKLITNNAKPKITTENKTYKLGEEVDFMAGVKANDAEDGDLTSKVEIISNNYEENKIGRFDVIYRVTDKDNNVVEKKSYITVYEDFVVKKSKFGQFDNLDKYNKEFKLNISSVSNNAGNYPGSPIGNAIDGNANTHWETNKPNSDTFENEVIFDLGESKEISKIAYKPRNGGKGFAKKFEIYTSNEAEGNDFILAGKGEYNGNVNDVVEFNISKKNSLQTKKWW